jgi:UDP-4-amino-4-deoxy-L-arabinose-oxoglutarate aminotransferase
MTSPDDRLDVQFTDVGMTNQDVEAVAEVLRSGWITTGPVNALFEEELAERVGARFVRTVSSCTAALEIALAFLRLPPGTAVAIPTWTFVSTAHAVVRSGGAPVWVDSDPHTLNMCPRSLERALSDCDIGCVIPVHFAGNPVSAEIRTLCESFGAPMIEDAAHAFGAVDDRGPVGARSWAGTAFSFYATKNLTCGEGGAVATNDPDLADFCSRYRLHGMSSDALGRYRASGPTGYDVTETGIKANLPDILAAIGRSQLARFSSNQRLRRRLSATYRQLLAGTSVEVVPPEQNPGSADHLFPVILPEGTDRELLISMMRQDGVQPGVHFRPVHTFSLFAGREHMAPGGLQNAEELQHRQLSLPLHPVLDDSAVERVVRSLERHLI